MVDQEATVRLQVKMALQVELSIEHVWLHVPSHPYRVLCHSCQPCHQVTCFCQHLGGPTWQLLKYFVSQLKLGTTAVVVLSCLH